MAFRSPRKGDAPMKRYLYGTALVAVLLALFACAGALADKGSAPGQEKKADASASTQTSDPAKDKSNNPQPSSGAPDHGNSNAPGNTTGADPSPDAQPAGGQHTQQGGPGSSSAANTTGAPQGAGKYAGCG